jgi:hypothetical protein
MGTLLSKEPCAQKGRFGIKSFADAQIKSVPSVPTRQVAK